MVGNISRKGTVDPLSAVGSIEQLIEVGERALRNLITNHIGLG